MSLGSDQVFKNTGKANGNDSFRTRYEKGGNKDNEAQR